MDCTSNPGEATPQMLYALYKPRAAAAANPFVLRDVQNANQSLDFRNTLGMRSKGHAASGAGSSSGGGGGDRLASEEYAEQESLLQQRAIMTTVPPTPVTLTGSAGRDRRRGESPPRQHFRVITPGNRVPLQGASAVSHRLPPSGPLQSPAQGGGGRNRCGAAYASSPSAASGCRTGLQLTLNSLDMSRRS